MKKVISLLIAVVMVFSLTACSSKPSSTDTKSNPANQAEPSTSAGSTSDTDISGTSLEVAVQYTGDQLTVFQKLVDDFQKEYDCKVNISAYGDDYETTLKTRMASNELPDIFVTHGWSILRYKEYLMNLNDQDWAKTYDASALGVIKDTDGAIYVLMISELVNGTLADLEVCKAADVDPYSIHTWDDFTDACAKIKTAGYTPISNAMGAGEMANVAGTWYNYQGEKYQLADSMLDGTFDWSNYKDMLSYYANWINNGYFYEDIATMSATDFSERWASDKAAFFIGNDPGFLVAVKQLNTNGNYALLPSFASTDSGVQFCGIGEGDAFGIWKDTKNEAAAKVFLNYLARPEVATTINSATGKIGAIASAIEADNYGQQLFSTMKEKFPNVYYENLWDRQYMPSGMWPIFDNAGKMFLDDHSDKGMQATIDYLSENYSDLYEQAHAQ